MMARVCMIEGLFSYFPGFLNLALKKDLKKMGHEVVRYSHATAKRNGILMGTFDICIGHSMGARYSISNINFYKKKPKLLITLDARGWDYKMNNKLKVPHRLEKHVNFFQSGFMPGHPIKGADNHLVVGAHIFMPWTCKEEIIKLVEEIR